MRDQFSLSDVGLKLIKSYEGFRSEISTLRSGRQVIGYGHLVNDDTADTITQEKAENLLRTDLRIVESAVNEMIFAPLSQGQFDALCSLAFNIGIDAFSKSDVVYALNNGRIIDAANAFDVWRKSEINGETYVIDSLVRRRTSEKILFLRPDRAQPLAPRMELCPVKDDEVTHHITPDIERIHKDSGVVPWPATDVVDAVEFEGEDTEIAIEEQNHDAALVTSETGNHIVEMDSGIIDQDDDNGTEEAVLSNDQHEYLSEEKNVTETAIPLAAGVGTKTLYELAVEDNDAVEDNASLRPILQVVKGDNTSNLAVDDITFDNNSTNQGEDNILIAKLVEDLTAADEKSDTHNEGFEATEIVDEVTIEENALFVHKEAILSTGTDDQAEIISETQPQTSNEIEHGESSISDAAHDFRTRLDALMDSSAREEDVAAANIFDENIDDLEIPESRLQPEVEKVEVNPGTDSYKEEFFNIIAEQEDKTPQGFDTQGTLPETPVKASSSAIKFIKHDPNKPNAHKQSGRPFLTMIAVGLVLIGASLGSFLTGLDAQFGMAGDFATTVGTLLGLLLILGAFYYLVKTQRQKRLA
ncbi:MAG: lysozyme [Maricaulaceae bacterium]